MPSRRPTPAAAITQLRRWRTRPDPDLSLAGVMAGQARTIQKLERSTGAAATAWTAAVPPALARHTALISLVRGTLTVRVTDAAARFELDRWLRDGGELQVIRRCVTSLTRIRLTA